MIDFNQKRSGLMDYWEGVVRATPVPPMV